MPVANEDESIFSSSNQYHDRNQKIDLLRWIDLAVKHLSEKLACLSPAQYHFYAI